MEASILSIKQHRQQSVCLIVLLFVCVWLWRINIENTRNKPLLKNINYCIIIIVIIIININMFLPHHEKGEAARRPPKKLQSFVCVAQKLKTFLL